LKNGSPVKGWTPVFTGVTIKPGFRQHDGKEKVAFEWTPIKFLGC
jgi:hypothetical protein